MVFLVGKYTNGTYNIQLDGDAYELLALCVGSMLRFGIDEFIKEDPPTKKEIENVLREDTKYILENLNFDDELCKSYQNSQRGKYEN